MNPSEIFPSTCLFDGEQRAEGLFEIFLAGGQYAVSVNDDARMVLKERRHGLAEAVTASPDFAGNDRRPARKPPFRAAEVAEIPLRAVPPGAVQREDDRKPGMAVQNSASARMQHNPAVG